MTIKKEVIRKGSPFSLSSIEELILSGMKSSSSLHRDGNKFYAGDVAYCPRRAVKFLMTDRIGSTTPSSMAYMKLGNTIHELVTDALHSGGHLIFKEFRLPPAEAPDLRGVIDAVIFAPGDKIMGLEIKSCGNLPSRPKEDHIAQATIYAAVSGLEFAIVYVSRKVAGFDGKLMIKSFDLECTEHDLVNALTKACLAHYAYNDGVMPTIPAGFTKADCTFCPFADECWDEEPQLLPDIPAEKADFYYEKAEQRAYEILEGREARRKGILKHITRYAPSAIQKKLETMDWGSP
jgi:hypothetical protein